MPEDLRQKNENEWFARHEEELLRQARRAHESRMAELTARQKQGEDRRLREMHWMKCPKCGHDMQSLSIETVEVDRCGTCEGIFFDKGELDAVLLSRDTERRGFFRRLTGF